MNNKSARGAIAVVAMMAVAMLLAGCPASKPSAEADKAASGPAPAKTLAPEAPVLPPLAPSKPEPPPAKPQAPPEKPLPPPAPKAVPAKPSVQAIPRTLPEPESKPVVISDRPAVPESGKPAKVTTNLPFVSPALKPTTMRPVPPQTLPRPASDEWTPRPNPLRGDRVVTPLRPESAGPRPLPPSVLPGPETIRPAIEEKTPPVTDRAKPSAPAAALDSPPPPAAPMRVEPAEAIAANHDEIGFGRGATKKRGSYDPIKENGPIFLGRPQDPGAWAKPRVALVVTGRMEGYIEPCGCAGLDRMKGGISRRHTMLDQLRAQGWPVVAIDLGSLSKGFGRQAELKFQTAVEALKRMGYSAIGLGLSDLRLPGGELLSVAKGVGNQQSPFISANVGLFTLDPPMVDSYRVIEAGGMRIGITAVLGREFQKRVQNADLIMVDPVEKLAAVLPKLKKEADYLVLLAYATTEESMALGRRFPEFSLVVTAGGGPEPPADPAQIDGRALLVEVGEKGMNAIVIGLYDNALRPWRYERVPLDSRFRNSPEMRMLMESYQDQLKTLGFGGLGLRAVPVPERKLMGSYVGSAKCQDCHEESYRVWRKSGHSHAYRTLTDLNPARNYDPECISCHVIGWHPQENFPYEGGFTGIEATPKLTDVGCESCHGPGAAHIAAEKANDPKAQAALRKAVTVTKDDAQRHLCSTCHDLDNSPDFKFETYWPKVEHKEK